MVASLGTVPVDSLLEGLAGQLSVTIPVDPLLEGPAGYLAVKVP